MPVVALRYGSTAKTLHWVIAALIAIQLPLGWLMPDIRRAMIPGSAMSLHISIGITILLLVVLRFLWRLSYPVAAEASLPGWQRIGAELVHWVLYLVVLLTTLSGWFFASFRGWTVRLYGIAPMPHLVAQGSALGRSLGGFHLLLVWVLMILVGAHILAALFHQFLLKDRVLYRMLPG